ncbi:SIR2 family protein [Pseudomonas sp. EA_15y_Pfl1_P102]|uniref:SIR2 family protein n=1 Tax=Pseudomonas sp. EA_15y_Pfl1_P102 TaxID=3088685 RepID=UPI0030D7524D
MDGLTSATLRQPALPRFMCHLYQRLQQQRLNLVTGAGISIDAGVPNWFGLLERLAQTPSALAGDYQAHRTAGLTPEYLGQIIYNRRRNSEEENLNASDEATMNHDWAASIHEAIYKDVPKSVAELITNHPYLSQLKELAKKIPFVINFNFDDILAQAISYNPNRDIQDRSFSVEWRPALLDRPNHTTIYHVNGLLPQVSLKKRSPKLIFTEDSFADAMARAPGVSAEYIFMRFVQNTMLIVGHSLADASLKNYLRLNRDKSPANHHYMIHWIRDESSLSSEQQSDIFNANLDLYNVFTIFLTSAEMSSFFSTLNLNKRDFADKLEGMGEDRRSRWHYYIVGPVAAGKSSLLEHLRCFDTHEEWTRPPPSEMYRSFKTLSKDEVEKVDGFVYGELKEKNSRMHAAEIGFHFMDRGPLDLYAFSQSEEENKKKTAAMIDIITRQRAWQNGEIIFLEAKGGTLVSRNYSRGRSPEQAGEEGYLDTQTAALKNIYKPTFILNTEDQTPGQIAKRVVRKVLLKSYNPTNLTEVMERHA